MTRVAVIVPDNKVRNGEITYEGLDLSGCGIPANVWALQWEEWEANKGHIEFRGTVPNEDITSLPAWVTPCLAVWQAKHDEVLAEIAAAEAAAAEAAAQQGA